MLLWLGRVRWFPPDRVDGIGTVEFGIFRAKFVGELAYELFSRIADS